MASQTSAVPADADQKPASIWDLLKPVIDTSVLFGFLSSLAGWSYLSAYFRVFGLRPMELDVSSTVTSVITVSLLYRLWIPLVLAILLVFALRFFHLKFPAVGNLGIMIVLLVISLATYITGALMGNSEARRDSLDVSPNLPAVGFFVGETMIGYPPCVGPTPRIECRMLLHVRGAYLFFEPLDNLGNPQDTQSQNLQVFALPESEVKLIQYQRGVQ